MKIIQHPFFLLLWSTGFVLSAAQDGPLPTSISEYPYCVQQGQCLELASSTYCSLTPTIGCVCQKQALNFFVMLYTCALSVCLTADTETAINLALEQCNKRGYNPSSIIKEALATPTYTLPSMSNFPTTILGSTGTGTSNPSTTSNTPNTSTGSKSLSTAAIIGIVVGSVAVIAIIAGLIVFCMKHRANQQRLQATDTVPPSLPPAVPQPPPQMAQYAGSPPPGYPPYTTPLYPPHQQPITQQQQQPLMQGYQELEQPAAGYYAATKEAEAVSSSVPTTTTATPAPLPPGHQEQYFQELSAQQSPAQGGQVFVEMPSDNQRR